MAVKKYNDLIKTLSDYEPRKEMAFTKTPLTRKLMKATPKVEKKSAKKYTGKIKQEDYSNLMSKLMKY